jgi:hypothetical protein
MAPLREDLIPPLRAWLLSWVEKRLVDPREAGDRVYQVATALNVPPVDAYGEGDVLGWLETYWAQGDEQLLDVVHATLHVLDNAGVVYRPPHPYVEVDKQLAYGRSAWEATKSGLIRRVDPTAQAAFERAITLGDPVSDDLREAWANAINRDGNPADAWDHAIKAAEAALRPIVCPNNGGATMSNIIGDLRSQPHLFTFRLRGRRRDHGLQGLIDMLELMWPDPRRHGSPAPEPAATSEEARAVANLAVTIVQWARDGLLVRR